MKYIFFLLLLVALSGPVYSQISLDVSAGLASQSYNEVKIPNEVGTAFDLYKDFKIQGPVINYSLKLGYRFKEKNHLFVLYAPLSVNYEGAAPFDIRFENTTFLQGQNVDARYQFNSYRVTYRRDVYTSDKWLLGVGFTAKIRDAEIRLKTADNSDKKVDVGFVPLLNLHAEYAFNSWSAYFEGDGLAGGPGRAFDLYLGGKIPLNDYLKIKAAYRLLEGGADVASVYNFTMVHFATLGIIIHF